MVATVIYYIFKVLLTVWIISYCVIVMGSHITFFSKGTGSAKDMFIFSSSLLLGGVLPAILWANEIYHLGGN